jgi:hypothetical protein
MPLHVPQVNDAPGVDASVDARAWNSAAKITSLSMCSGPPGKGLTPTPTQVLLLWDRQFLYVRFRSQDDDIYAPHGAEPNALHSDGDVVEVFIDPRGDGRQYMEFQVSPMGGFFTALHLITTEPVSTSDGLLAQDIIHRDLWSIPGWEIKGLRTSAAIRSVDGKPGWVADMAIPAEAVLRRLGRKAFSPMSLRANFLRYDRDQPSDAHHHQKMIFMNWSPVLWGCPHMSPATMGTLILDHP